MKNKLIIVVDVDTNKVNEEGLRYALEQGFSSDDLTVDRVIKTQFNAAQEFSLAAAALLDNYLDYSEKDYTDEQHVAIAKWIADAEVLMTAISECSLFAIENVIGDEK